MAAVDILIEVFTWAGLGGAALLGVLAVVLWAADGSWLPARGVVDDPSAGTSADGVVVRWFDGDGEANSATLTDAEAREVGTRSMVDLFYRHGWRGRMRLRRRSPGVTAALRLAGGFAALGLLALVTGWVVLFAKG